MNRTTTFQIPLGVEQLRPPVFAGAQPTPLAEPLQALVTAASRRAADAPFTIYLCADDDTTRARDDFAIALARALTANIPSTLVVDCDFLHPGLNGHVPQRDALGFLDYLLYGSSIGVITQENGGVHMVGPGSFPVTKRMPFIDTAFADAARRLVAHARCLIFVGPAFDGDGGRHPLMNACDVCATVRSTPRHPRMDSAEEHVAGAGAEVWSIRLGEAAAVTAAAPPPPPAPASRKPLQPQPRPQPAAPAASRAPDAAAPPVDAPADVGAAASSLAPRIAVIVIGLLVIAFVAWWYLQTREASTLSGAEDTNEVAVNAPDTTRRAPATTAARDTVAQPAATRDTTAVAPPPVAVPPPASSARASGGGQLVSSEDIQLMEDLDRRYNGWFMIHISSFQTSAKAREEAAFLESREFPVFIVFLDLGPKGKWYRVYSGPFQTREEARDVKKNLDAIPQVRFTRIASIPD